MDTATLSAETTNGTGRANGAPSSSVIDLAQSVAALDRIDRDIEAALGAGVALAGRHFCRAKSTTVDQVIYTTFHAQEAGLSRVLKGFDPLRDEMDDTQNRLLVAAFNSGHLYHFLAGVLLQNGTTWSRESADHAAQFFRDLRDPTDHAALFAVAEWAVVDFFLEASGSRSISRKFSSMLRSETAASNETGDLDARSDPARAAAERSETAETVDRTSPSPDAIVGSTAASTGSATGNPSSAPSPSTTPPASRAS